MKKKRTNIFTKYMVMFMAIILITVTIIGIIITSFIENFSIDSRKKELSNYVVSFETMIGDIESNETLSDAVLEEENVLKDSIYIAFRNSPNCSIIVLDETGKMIMREYYDIDNNEIKINYGDDILDNTDVLKMDTMPEEIMDEIFEEKDISMRRDCKGFFVSNVILFASSVQNVDNENIGCIIAYAQTSNKGDLANTMMSSILLAILWISITALVGIYGVSYTAMRPLREIGEAAKQFSRGNFNVRVPVRGNDELGELANLFNEMAEALQAKDEMQKNFLSNASHDLRTPMTTISGFVDGILDGAIPYDKQDYYLNIIKKEVTRLSRLVSSLLDISRLQSGERKFDIKPFNICEIARQTVISFETQFEIKELDVDFEFEEFDMIALGDKDAINQVIYNLCHNAIKFSYQKGKYVVSVKYEEDKIVFSIYNEGIGISSKDLPFVFDRFYKSDKSRGLDKTGVGLGLFICKTIIEAHGEKISVKSEYGKNCTFSFSLKRGDI